MGMSTNYAIRIIVELTKHSKCNVTELCSLIGVSDGYLRKILVRLKNNGLIESFQGIDGGFRLSKSTKEISLYDVMLVMESSMRINRCMEDDEFCSQCAVKRCNIRQLYGVIQKNIDMEFRGLTIYDLLESKEGGKSDDE